MAKSFSMKVKKELSKYTGEARHCKIAELSAIICCSGRIIKNSTEPYSLEMRTDSVYAAKKFKQIIKYVFDSLCTIEIRNAYHKNNSFILKLNDKSTVEKVLKSTGITLSGDGIIKKIPNLVVRSECCMRAFIRGVFLCCGSVSEPSRGNHFELMTGAPGFSGGVSELLVALGLGLKPRIAPRKGHTLVYFKDGAQICDILCAFGAYNSVMAYENSRIVKEVNNTINRRVNFQNANMDKAMEAAFSQIKDIMLIEKKRGLSSLPESLEEISRARLDNPEMSLKEIGLLLSPPVGKSGVNHRLRKISAIADSLR